MFVCVCVCVCVCEQMTANSLCGAEMKRVKTAVFLFLNFIVWSLHVSAIAMQYLSTSILIFSRYLHVSEAFNVHHLNSNEERALATLTGQNL